MRNGRLQDAERRELAPHFADVERLFEATLAHALDEGLGRGSERSAGEEEDALRKLGPAALQQHAVSLVQERPDLRIVGIDIATTMVKRSRALATRMNVADKVAFELGDAQALPFADESFDAVYCAGPLKQVADKSRALRECYRVLRRGGRLLVMDVNRGCSYEDVVAFVNRTTLPELGRRVLKIYFSAIVARQSIDLDEVRALWAELPLVDCDGPRRIPDHPAFVAVGTKP